MVIHIENLSYAWKHCKNPLSHDTCTIHLKKKNLYLLHWTLTGPYGYKQYRNRWNLPTVCVYCYCQMEKKKVMNSDYGDHFFSFLTRASKEFCGPKCHKGCKCSVQVKTYKLLSKLHFEVGWFAFLQQQQFATVNKVRENGADLDLKEGFHLD